MFDISTALHTKKWTDISLSDWRMTGVGVQIIIAYLTPSVFAYYLPSLISTALKDMEFDYALSALLPANQRHEPRGVWWPEFLGCFNASQKGAIRLFLTFVLQSTPEDGEYWFQAEAALSAGYYDT
jgi:hypothetical protein